MFDEMDRLREVEPLERLLQHYQELGTPDRMVWQDRLRELGPRLGDAVVGTLVVDDQHFARQLRCSEQPAQQREQ